MYALRVNGLGCTGKRLLTVTVVMESKPNIMKATTRTVHGNPMRGISLLIMMGMITPPSDEPETMTPNAYARLAKNQVTMDEVQALKTADELNAATMPWDSRNW